MTLPVNGLSYAWPWRCEVTAATISETSPIPAAYGRSELLKELRNDSHRLHDRALRAPRLVRAEARVWSLWISVRHSVDAALVGGEDRDRRRTRVFGDPHRESRYGASTALA